MAEQALSQQDPMDKPLPLWLMIAMPFYVTLIMAVFVFPAAGDLRWLNGWLLVLALSLTISAANVVINRRNPRVLRNRMKTRKQGLTAKTEKAASSDRFLMPVLAVGMIGAIVLPGLEYRFGWPMLPLWVSLVAAGLMIAGLIITHVAMLHNAYASKLLDINEGQTLVDTGLYAHVRHPLYSGAVLWIVFMPLTLGSLWGLLPAGVAALTLVVRIPFEEKMLLDGMDGYADYQQRVRSRLIPGIY